jgi:hypothetical protein
MSSVRQRRLFGCQLVTGRPLIVCNRGENEPITGLNATATDGPLSLSSTHVPMHGRLLCAIMSRRSHVACGPSGGRGGLQALEAEAVAVSYEL